MKDKHNNPNQVNTTNMVSPLNSPDDLAEAESLTNEMLREMIMEVCFFISHLVRKYVLWTVPEMPRWVVRHNKGDRRRAFHGATVAALKKKLVKKSSDSDPMKREEVIGLLDK